MIYVVGSANLDRVVGVAAMPRMGETVLSDSLENHCGGKGANQAVACARAGGRVVFVGAMGHDDPATQLLASLSSAGADVFCVQRVDAPTGTAFVFVTPRGENAICVVAGANAALTEVHAAASLAQLKQDDVLLAQLEINHQVTRRALLECQRRGAFGILDPAPAQDFPADLLGIAALITPNQTEAALLLGRANTAIESPEAMQVAAEELLRSGARAVIVKGGAIGCVIASGSVREFIPAYRVKVIDSTGAGDVFNGALAACLGEGRALLESARFASAAAALSVTRKGAQSSCPTRSDIDEFIRKQK